MAEAATFSPGHKRRNTKTMVWGALFLFKKKVEKERKKKGRKVGTQRKRRKREKENLFKIQLTLFYQDFGLVLGVEWA